MTLQNALSEKSTYHHGNLRQALIDGAVCWLRTNGAERLSLRGLARQLGVSQAAPYRHFEDKVSLLSAVASDGFEKLASNMAQKMSAYHDDPVEALRQAGRAYIEFACAHPETYRLMYSMKRHEFNLQELQTCDTEAYKLLEKTVDAGLQSGHFKALDRDAIVTATWSMAHGFAQLVIDGVLDVDHGNIADQFDCLGAIINAGVVEF
ncbi:TetR/AcrR family transcriptional regulator [Aestuariibacter salexigens]|uniref:TetR/AcrR family transcriptional regulator n=1 Tax=Aestuariibacter salexigens TaxID=226010 RepID=UPI0003F8973F|nr:TetR/AcrR family transcriptional regulator [Aestuariibacter salexigens]